MSDSVAHLVPCDRRPLLSRPAPLLPASRQRSRWAQRAVDIDERVPTMAATTGKGSKHGTCAAFERDAQVPVKEFSWELATQNELGCDTRWEQGGNKRRASVDEPPQLTSVDLHVAVSRPLRNIAGA